MNKNGLDTYLDPWGNSRPHPRAAPQGPPHPEDTWARVSCGLLYTYNPHLYPTPQSQLKPESSFLSSC